jgi:urease subunit beta
MIPGELFTVSGDIEINAGRATVTLTVANTGDRRSRSAAYHFTIQTALAF